MAFYTNYIQTFVKLPLQFIPGAGLEHQGWYNQWWAVDGALDPGKNLQDVADYMCAQFGFLSLTIPADFNPVPWIEGHIWANFGGTITGPINFTPGSGGWVIGVIGLAGPSCEQVMLRLRTDERPNYMYRKYIGPLQAGSTAGGRYIEPVPGAMDLFVNFLLTQQHCFGLTLSPMGTNSYAHRLERYSKCEWRDSSPDGGCKVRVLKRRGKAGWAKPIPPYPMQEP